MLSTGKMLFENVTCRHFTVKRAQLTSCLSVLAYITGFKLYRGHQLLMLWWCINCHLQSSRQAVKESWQVWELAMPADCRLARWHRRQLNLMFLHAR